MSTWCGFAQEIMRLAGELGHRSVPIAPIATADYPTPARRPANSRLDCDRLQQDFGLRLPRWQESLADDDENSFGEHELRIGR